MKSANIVFAFSVLMFSMGALNGQPVTAQQQTGPAIDKPAPNFTLKGMDGKTVTLKDLTGKFVVLEWTNNGCPYVRKHYRSGNMQKTQRQLTEDNVVWLSIISSAPGKQGHVDAAEARRITAENGAYPTNVLLDPAGTVGRLYKASNTPQMFIIDRNGTLRYMGAMDDRPSAQLSSLEGATNYVIAAWNALKTGAEIKDKVTSNYGCAIKYAD